MRPRGASVPSIAAAFHVLYRTEMKIRISVGRKLTKANAAVAISRLRFVMPLAPQITPMPMDQLQPAYRLFPIDAAGRVQGIPDIIEAATDGQAVQAAEKLARDRTVELWAGIRHIATLNVKRGVR